MKASPLDNLSFGRYNMREYQTQEECTMTAKGTTKQGILDAALELFSVQGDEATSISQLAEAVSARRLSTAILKTSRRFWTL